MIQFICSSPNAVIRCRKREEAVLHLVDEENLLLVGGYKWESETAVEEDEEAFQRASELGMDEDDIVDVRGEEYGTATSLADPIWLFSTSANSWIPLQLNFSTSSLKDCIIRASAPANGPGGSALALSLIAQRTGDEPGALIWLSLRQKLIVDDQDLAKFEFRKYPAVTPSLMFNHPILYDCGLKFEYVWTFKRSCSSLSEFLSLLLCRRQGGSILRLQQSLLKHHSSFLATAFTGSWSEYALVRDQTQGNVAVFSLVDAEIDAVVALLKHIHGTVSIEDAARNDLSNILSLVNEANFFNFVDAFVAPSLPAAFTHPALCQAIKIV